MPQEIIRTEDVIECSDTKILATDDHIQLASLAGEQYSSILDKIDDLVCSASEAIALFFTRTSPSSLNPVVLKDDISTYYPFEDLGEIKDSVNDVIDLPLIGNTEGDLRPVTNIGAIYRWDGVSWVIFIKTGTIDHTQLNNQNADLNYLHVTLSELTALLSQSHTHANKAVLDAITALGSGIVISNDERGRIPTQDEKDAMEGTVPPPSSLNKFVTNIDPRLNTVKNPYVTFGLAGSGATFTGSDITDIETALTALATGGSIDFINALEFLPATYPLNAVNPQGMVWSDAKPLMLESLAFKQTCLQLSPLPAGSIGFWISSGDGTVTVRGFTFELGVNDTIGCLCERDNTVFEDCTFTTSSLLITGVVGVRVNANTATFRRCNFEGNIANALEINGNDCVIENCRFLLNNITYNAITLNGNNCQVTSSEITKGIVTVGTFSDVIFDKVRMSSDTSFIDSGINTRWLGGISQDYQQAYIGRTRTVGTLNSHADFRGTSETPFLAAMSDPYTTEVEIFDGSYTFSSPVTVPVGKSIKAINRDTVSISGGNCFILNNSTKLDGLNLNISVSDGITASSVRDIIVTGCTMNASGVYAINFNGVTDTEISHCQFSGTQGVYLTGDTRSKIRDNRFSTSGYSIISDVTTNELYYGDNIEEGSVCSLSGSNLLVRGNQFLGALPSKIGTLNSLWIGNYPPEANNTNGIDSIDISTSSLLKPMLTSGAYRSSFLGTASYAFMETGTPTLVTLPIFIGAKIDRTKGYAVTLNWTAAVFSGSVLWEVTTVFRDRADFVSDFGTPNTLSQLSPRTHLVVRQEETCTISFTSSDYGYIAGIDPTHVSLMIRRLGDNVTDTLAGIAYLTEAIITLPRD